MKSRWFTCLSVLFFLGCQSPSSRHDEVRFPNGITVVRARGEVHVPAVALLRSGWLEQAVCTPETRAHESLFALLVPPSELHAALLLAGGVPGCPGAPPALDQPAKRPSGSRLEVLMAHDGGVVKLEDLVIDHRTGRPLSGHFVFSGSMFVEWQGVSRYLADDEGSVVGLVTFGDELVAYSEPVSALVEQAGTVFRPNPDLMPPPGTQVVLRFTVVPEPEA